MLAKCAEAQAIRKGWPEDLSNTFVGEEIEQASLTLNPAQAAAGRPAIALASGACSRLVSQSSRRPPSRADWRRTPQL
jgi:hypothetical protein